MSFDGAPAGQNRTSSNARVEGVKEEAGPPACEDSADGGACGTSTCDEDLELVNGECLAPCEAGSHREDDVCVPNMRDCETEGGQGQQTWQDSDYGPCVPSSCSTGFELIDGSCLPACAAGTHREHQECVSDLRQCALPNGSGQEQWNGSGYGPCVPSSCSTGFELIDGSCVPACAAGTHREHQECVSNLRQCPLPNGSGQEQWNDGWSGVCQVTWCEGTFHIEGNACQPDEIRCRRKQTNSDICFTAVNAQPLIGSYDCLGHTYRVTFATCNVCPADVPAVWDGGRYRIPTSSHHGTPCRIWNVND